MFHLIELWGLVSWAKDRMGKENMGGEPETQRVESQLLKRINYLSINFLPFLNSANLNIKSLKKFTFFEVFTISFEILE